MNNGSVISRRKFMGAVGVIAGTTALAPIVARAQAPPAGKPADPASTITTPPRDWSPNANPTTYVDPDVITIDPLFNRYRQGNTPIKRLWTGALWSEGPAWSGQGRYLVWSDIPNNRQLRWLEEGGSVTVFRMPSNNSNGNTFDFQDRQLSCENLTRRVVRYEHVGNITTVATGSPIRRTVASCTKARPTRPAARAIRWAVSSIGSASRPKSRTSSARCPRPCIAPIRAVASTSSSAKTNCPTRTAWPSRPTTRSCMSSAPAPAPETRAQAASATCTCSTSALTTSCRTRSSSAISWSTALSAVPTAHAATSTATSGYRATAIRVDAVSATAA